MFIFEYLKSQEFVEDIISGMISDMFVATIAFFFGVMSYNFTKYKNSDINKRDESRNSDPILDREIQKKEEHIINNKRKIHTTRTSMSNYTNDNNEWDITFVFVTLILASLFFKFINLFVIGILVIWCISLLILIFFIYDYIKSKLWAPTQTAIVLLCVMNGVFIPLTISNINVPKDFEFNFSFISQNSQWMMYIFMFIGAILILMPTIILIRLIARVFFIVIFNKTGSTIAYNYILKTDNLVNKPVFLFLYALFTNMMSYLLTSGIASDFLLNKLNPM